MTPAQEQAARFTGALWKAICFAGGLHLEQHRHFRAAYDPAWLATLALPAGEDRPGGQPVALLDHRHRDIERHLDSQTLAEAYAHRPRTKVYEDIGHDGGDWYGLTTAHLARLSGSALPVTCAIFASRHGDETFGAHQDAWYGAIIQIDGAKTWQIGHRELTTRAGDILLLPKYLPHAVTTPAQPGHSLPLAFALDRDPPDWDNPAGPRHSQASHARE
jgi:hypothetical protein